MSVEVTQTHVTRNRKVRHTQEETTQWTLVHLAKARAKQSKGKHGKGNGIGKQGQHGQEKDKSKDKNKDSVE